MTAIAVRHFMKAGRRGEAYLARLVVGGIMDTLSLAPTEHVARQMTIMGGIHYLCIVILRENKQPSHTLRRLYENQVAS